MRVPNVTAVAVVPMVVVAAFTTDPDATGAIEKVKVGSTFAVTCTAVEARIAEATVAVSIATAPASLVVILTKNEPVALGLPTLVIGTDTVAPAV